MSRNGSSRPIELVRDVVRQSAPLRAGAHWLLARSPPLRRAVQRRLAAAGDAEYRAWIADHDRLTQVDRRAIAERVAQLPPVTFSIVMPVCDPREDRFAAAIASVRAQLWPGWELCIADDASTAPHVGRMLDELAADPRVRIVRRSQRGHIAAASNSALALASGDFVALLDHDDVLAEHALYWVAEEIDAHPTADLIYSDEDQLDGRGRRCQPAFKPDFDPLALLSRNFVSHLGVFRRGLLQELGGFREGFDGSQDHDLVLRVAERVPVSRIRHIPAVLYHWRQTGAASFSERALARCADASRRAVAEHLARSGIAADVVAHPLVPASVRVIRRIPDPAPLVSVIVPTRDRAELLADCVRGVLRGTDYPALELIVIDNASRQPGTAALFGRIAEDRRVRILHVADKRFNFSALCNAGATAAQGDILLLLNNDTEVMDPGWLGAMVAHAIRPEVGAVGAKLLYPNQRVQHAGLVLGCGPDLVAAHMFSGARRDAPGAAGALWLEREVGAVTAACLAIRRETYLAVGGMNEKDLPIAYNDVDLCLRLRAAGFAIVWTPFAELIHHESATRGADAGHARGDAASYMRSMWGTALSDDPFYNKNFSLASPYRLDAPRLPKPWRRGMAVSQRG
jgi:GT2 family glycosyltransferase